MCLHRGLNLVFTPLMDCCDANRRPRRSHLYRERKGGPATGICYDRDGNLLSDTFNTYAWNTENKLISETNGSITYDAFNNAVEKNGYEHLFAPGLGDIGLFSGQTPQQVTLPLPGSGSVIYGPQCTGVPIGYNHNDWHGNARITTTQSQGLQRQSEFSPFGQLYDNTFSQPSFLQFDSANMDTLPNVYDMANRNLHTIQGRWLQPDPAGLAAVDPSNPQSWNRYAYVTNNPLSYIDPTGLNDENVADAPPDGPGIYANGGWGLGTPYYGGGFGCTIDGFECGSTGVAGIGGLGGNGVAYCPQCGNPWQADRIGANGQVNVWEWLASDQPSDCSSNLCPARGYDWVLVGQPSYVPSLSDLMYRQVTGPVSPGPTTAVGPQGPVPTKHFSAFANYAGFLGCELNSFVATVTDQEYEGKATAFGFINAGALAAIRFRQANIIGITFVATAGAMDVGAMAKANQACTPMFYP